MIEINRPNVPSVVPNMLREPSVASFHPITGVFTSKNRLKGANPVKRFTWGIRQNPHDGGIPSPFAPLGGTSIKQETWPHGGVGSGWITLNMRHPRLSLSVNLGTPLIKKAVG